jgi:hypothetical protein
MSIVYGTEKQPETKRDIPWQVKFQEDDCTPQFSKRSLIAACRGNKRRADILDQFLLAGSWKVSNLKLPAGEAVEISKSHEEIRAKLPYTVSNSTLVADLDALNEWGFVLSERYGRTFTVQFKEIQAAMDNPPPVEKKPRGKHATKRKQTESSNIRTFSKVEHSEVSKVSNLELSRSDLLAKVSKLEDYVLKLEEKVLTLEEKVLTLELSEVPSCPSTSWLKGSFSPPTIITTTYGITKSMCDATVVDHAHTPFLQRENTCSLLEKDQSNDSLDSRLLVLLSQPHPHQDRMRSTRDQAHALADPVETTSNVSLHTGAGISAAPTEQTVSEIHNEHEQHSYSHEVHNDDATPSVDRADPVSLPGDPVLDCHLAHQEDASGHVALGQHQSAVLSEHIGCNRIDGSAHECVIEEETRDALPSQPGDMGNTHAAVLSADAHTGVHAPDALPVDELPLSGSDSSDHLPDAPRALALFPVAEVSTPTTSTGRARTGQQKTEKKQQGQKTEKPTPPPPPARKPHPNDPYKAAYLVFERAIREVWEVPQFVLDKPYGERDPVFNALKRLVNAAPEKKVQEADARDVLTVMKATKWNNGEMPWAESIPELRVILSKWQYLLADIAIARKKAAKAAEQEERRKREQQQAGRPVQVSTGQQTGPVDLRAHNRALEQQFLASRRNKSVHGGVA